MAITFGAGPSIRGWLPHEDYTIELQVQDESTTGTTGTTTVKDLTYNTTASTATKRKYNLVPTQTPGAPPITYESLTPGICTIDADGVTTMLADGTCTVEAKGRTGKRRYSQTMSTLGAATLYDSVQSIVAGSLRAYLRDQHVAALASVLPGSAAQRAHATPSSAGFTTSGSSVNTANFLRAQTQPGFDPFQLDLLGEILVGVAGSAQWRAWITPNHYLTWSGHGSASITGQRVSIKGEIVVEYSATPWTGPLCKLLPSTYATKLPTSLKQYGWPGQAGSLSSAFHVWARLYNTYDVGADHRWVMPAEWHFGVFQQSSPLRAYQKLSNGTIANGGDSGSPVFVGIREPGNTHATLVPIGITSYQAQVGGMTFVDNLTAIQAAVTLLNASGAFTVQTVDLSAFTTY